MHRRQFLAASGAAACHSIVMRAARISSARQCRVLEEDPDLGEAVPLAQREQALAECTAAAVRIASGPWNGEVAAELGVKAASLYWHVRDKEQLLDLLTDELMADAEPPDVIVDRECPVDGNIDAPDSHAPREQGGNRDHQQQQQCAREHHGSEPATPRRDG